MWKSCMGLCVTMHKYVMTSKCRCVNHSKGLWKASVEYQTYGKSARFITIVIIFSSPYPLLFLPPIILITTATTTFIFITIII